MNKYHLTYNFNQGLWLIPIYIIKEKCFITGNIFVANFGLSKELINLDSQQIKGHITMSLLQAIYLNEGCQRTVALHLTANCLRNDYETALQLYKYIPQLLTYLKYDIPEHYLIALCEKYLALSQWLYLWHKKHNTKKLKNNILKNYEKSAFVSLKRYEVIYELYNLGIFDIHTYNHPELPLTDHNLIWLLWELSIVINDINKGRNQSKGLTPSVFYEKNREYINDLKEVIDKYQLTCDSQYIDNPELQIIFTSNLVYKLDEYLQGLSKTVAKKNREFDKHYFTPYTEALTSENSHGKKACTKKEMKLVTYNPQVKNKPGRRPKRKSK